MIIENILINLLRCSVQRLLHVTAISYLLKGILKLCGNHGIGRRFRPRNGNAMRQLGGEQRQRPLSAIECRLLYRTFNPGHRSVGITHGKHFIGAHQKFYELRRHLRMPATANRHNVCMNAWPEYRLRRLCCSKCRTCSLP